MCRALSRRSYLALVGWDLYRPYQRSAAKKGFFLPFGGVHGGGPIHYGPKKGLFGGGKVIMVHMYFSPAPNIREGRPTGRGPPASGWIRISTQLITQP